MREKIEIRKMLKGFVAERLISRKAAKIVAFYYGIKIVGKF